MDYKDCACCGKTKFLIEFKPTKQTKDGRSHNCYVCVGKQKRIRNGNTKTT